MKIINMFYLLKNKIKKIPIVLNLYGKIQNRERKIYWNNKNLFNNKKGLEIGGPSNIFSKGGAFPIYKLLKHLDNVNFSENNFWSKISEGNNFIYDIDEKKGSQFIADGINLRIIDSLSYDVLLASHVLEHIANPIKALFEWKRVLKINGYIVLIVPNKSKTYDRKRPLTTLNHIIDDYNLDIGEDDNTHIEEVINLHDLTNDGTVDNFFEHKKRSLDNFKTRIVHHHTFNCKLVLELLEYCDFNIIQSQVFSPYHILVIAQKVD